MMLFTRDDLENQVKILFDLENLKNDQREIFGTALYVYLIIELLRKWWR